MWLSLNPYKTIEGVIPTARVFTSGPRDLAGNCSTGDLSLRLKNGCVRDDAMESEGFQTGYTIAIAFGAGFELHWPQSSRSARPGARSQELA